MSSIALDFQLVSKLAPELLVGLKMTLLVGTISAIGAVGWGLLLTWPRMSKRGSVRALVVTYIELVRNSPLLIQMYLLFFGLPVFGIFVPAFWCGVLAIVAQHGAFMCETFRSGIESINPGQWQAGRSLGLRDRAVFRLIVWPQALQRLTPAITNQLIILAKDTSLVSAIGVMEMTQMGKLSVERSAATFEVFVVIGVFYLILTSIIGLAGRMIEGRLRMRTGRV